MMHFRSARCLVIAALASGLYAQDASMVRRTGVSFRTARNSLQLTEEQRQTADQMAREAAQAGQAGKYGEAMRAYHHGMAVMQGQAWTPAYEFAASLSGRLDHAVIDPGKPIGIRLSPLYECPGAGELKASIVLVPSRTNGAAETSLGEPPVLKPGAVPFSTNVTPPASAVGDYVVEVRLAVDGASVKPGTRAALVKALPVHIESLAAPAQQLKDRLAKVSRKEGSAFSTAEYALELYERADRGEVNPTQYRFAEEFARAGEILDGLNKGRDYFDGKPGDFRKAYRSAVDQMLQPYRIFIPSAYTATKPIGLVIALHGMGGDENGMLDGYNVTLKREAERVGVMVACPKGRDPASMYAGTAERDVMDVLAEVRRDYKIDSDRIYLMGHSMGGYGTLSVAMAHPDVFAALGPIAGGGNPAGMAKLAKVPQYVVHGDDDRTVPVTQSRLMVEAGKKAGAAITYVEVPGGSHSSVVAPQIGPMLDFFVKQKKTSQVNGE